MRALRHHGSMRRSRSGNVFGATMQTGALYPAAGAIQLLVAASAITRSAEAMNSLDSFRAARVRCALHDEMVVEFGVDDRARGLR